MLSVYSGAVETVRELIERWLPEYGLVPTGQQRELLARYLELVRAGNERVRLVGSTEPEVLVRRHLGESLFLGTMVPLASQKLLDLGSGAGFPGLPLALAFGLQTTLVESNQKKAAFLRACASELRATNLTVENIFLERRPKSGYSLPADLVTVRALERMELVPAWLDRWLAPGTTAAFWATRDRAAQWTASQKRWDWSTFHPLPGAMDRGIILSVPRGTSGRRGTSAGMFHVEQSPDLG